MTQPAATPDPAADAPSSSDAPRAAAPHLQPLTDAIHEHLAAERARLAAREAERARAAEFAADVDWALGSLRRIGRIKTQKVAKAAGTDPKALAAALAQWKAETAPEETQPTAAVSGARGGEESAASASPPDAAGGDGEGWHREKTPIKPLPDDCPVIPVGVAGGVYYFLSPRKDLEGVKKFDADTLRRLFGERGDYLWALHPKFNRQSGRQDGWKADRTADSLIHACAQRPTFDPIHHLRGAGGWTDEDGRLILHCGDALLVDGAWRAPGLLGGAVYPAMPALPRPLEAGEPGEHVDWFARLVDEFSWINGPDEAGVAMADRPLGEGLPKLATLLVLGHQMAVIAGAALRYRPIMWLTGDAGSGKSLLMEVCEMVQGGGLLKSADATPAGVYLTAGRSCLGVAIDEMEPDPENPRIRAMVKLARSSATGAKGLRGTDKLTGTAFELRSAFLFGSILIPPQLSQDLSRTAIMEMGPAPGGKEFVLDRARLRLAGRALRRRLVEGWPRLPETLAAWRAALVARGHNQRSCDQWGTLLALADLALGREALHPEQIADVAASLARERIDAAHYIHSNAEAMLNHIISTPLDVFRGGTRMTIGQLVAVAAGLTNSTHCDDKQAREALIPWGVFVQGWRAAARVTLPNQSRALITLFARSAWGGEAGASGAWAQAMRRLPEVRAENSRKLGGRGYSVPARVFLQDHDEDDAPPPDHAGETF